MVIIEPRKRMVVPHNCVEFLERFKIHQTVRFVYSGGMGGVYEIEGAINKIDRPDFVVQKPNGDIFNATMADIVFITLLSESERENQIP